MDERYEALGIACVFICVPVLFFLFIFSLVYLTHSERLEVANLKRTCIQTGGEVIGGGEGVEGFTCIRTRRESP